ncbi:extracellular solute-binding protein [Cohnella nanjingensis]|uniref:Extracellular solute-binding protein n=1 Tax=Cohnella nanjingensis TaxID=1387779 RepID=A0A7X0RTI8_9BACL|nr:extracellular solute-binding protein [Cohnella nanjingensis]MBB6673251.1 extracellular solute-binding protein [Cohnella nanjingensis]
MRAAKCAWVRFAASAAALLMLCSCFGGGGDGSAPAGSAAEPAAYAPYDAPVTLRIPHLYADIQLPEGDTSENNFLTRYLTKQTGISIRYVWEAQDELQYVSKTDYAIRSGDLPDALVVNREQFLELARSGQLADLTDIYPKYASSLVQSLYDATDGKAIRDATVDGRLYGLPNVAIEADAPTYVWVRQDWLDRLKLAPPRTLDDIARIVQTFRKADPDGDGRANTAGIPVDRSLVFDQTTGNNGLNGVFAAFHAFPKRWIAGADGKPVYGSIQPEAKRALALLADWYRAGILDRDFMLRQDPQDLVATNQAGLFFGPWWAPYYPLPKSVAADTKAEWQVYAVPIDDSGQFVTSTAPTTDRYLVVRQGFAHPEAVLKLLNVFTRLERNQDPNGKQLLAYTEQTGVQLRNYYPFDLLLDHPDAVVQRHDRLVQALAGDIDPDQLDAETKRLYDDAVTERDNPLKNINAWSDSQAYLLGGAVSKTKMIRVESFFPDPTPTMLQEGEALRKLEEKTYAKIISGEWPIDAFDAFVERWKRSGGDRIAAEVAESVRGSA